MGDVVGSITGTAIEILLQNLISLCAEDISLVRNFKKDLKKLEESLDMIQAFLNDAEKKQVTKEAVKRWLKNLEAVAFDADNVLDELNYEVLRKKAETGNKLKKKVRALFSFSTRSMAVKMREINERLDVINQEANSYGLQSQLSIHATSFVSDSLAERETDSYSVDPIFFGRGNYAARIVETLTCSSPVHDEHVVVLPIVGMGGLGKTTLARLVFHDEKIHTHFDERVWVYVSENFDAKYLFKKILESLTGKKVDLEGRDALLRNLHENLEAKKYLLVLDDVWIEETKKWGDFMDTLSSISSVKGNGIIVTTRSEKVALIVGTIPVPELGSLPDEDCWSIIKEKAFKKGCLIPLEFEAIGKKIAKRCQGLPLAAKVLGGLLREKSKEEWHSIEETRLSDLGKDGNTVRKILKLSFDNLPSQSLKKCFAFCSIFPKSFQIEMRMLNYLWMSEGFLQSHQVKDIETVGIEYLELLLQNSLLQVLERDYRSGNIKYCIMHDLVHDLACSILAEAGPIRYIFMKSITDISKEAIRNLRSLIFEGGISNDRMFSDFKSLRSLVLIGDCDSKELPNVEHLIHLRYLDILEAKIERLPDSIGNLYHLQTLRANNALNELPKTLKKLLNLRHIDILKSNQQDKYKTMTINEIPMLGHLPHLKSLNLEDLPKVRSIDSSSDGIHDQNTSIVFPALKNLTLRSMSSMTGLLTAGETLVDGEVVPFSLLESLLLFSCRKLTSGPSHFPYLKELVIYQMDTSFFVENLLARLTSLMKLTVVEVAGLVYLPIEFFRNNQYLSYLNVRDCDNLTHLAPFLGASLREIEIRNCQKMEELPEDLHSLNSLAKLVIATCQNLKSIPYDPSSKGHESAQGFTCLKDLRIVLCRVLTELPIGMLESCTLSLETVYLYGLKSLTNMASVIACLQKMPHLTTSELDFKYIPELYNNDFPLEIGSFNSLRDLSISCRMKDWDRVQDQLQRLKNLRTLRLNNMEIEVVPEWLGNLSSLEELILLNCQRLTRLPSKEAMKGLSKLTVFNCPLLNLKSDEYGSEWHKIPHITNIRSRPWYSYQDRRAFKMDSEDCCPEVDQYGWIQDGDSPDEIVKWFLGTP